MGGEVGRHPRFSTALVKLPNSICVDIATARLEYYPRYHPPPEQARKALLTPARRSSPAALPCVELSSLKMDLYRRDFTINAMVPLVSFLFLFFFLRIGELIF
jgi:tRNA nucleotidyltransferase (CCA-adding enzyme)